jgi:hypothetical protein
MTTTHDVAQSKELASRWKHRSHHLQLDASQFAVQFTRRPSPIIPFHDAAMFNEHSHGPKKVHTNRDMHHVVREVYIYREAFLLHRSGAIDEYQSNKNDGECSPFGMTYVIQVQESSAFVSERSRNLPSGTRIPSSSRNRNCSRTRQITESFLISSALFRVLSRPRLRQIF